MNIGCNDEQKSSTLWGFALKMKAQFDCLIFVSLLCVFIISTVNVELKEYLWCLTSQILAHPGCVCVYIFYTHSSFSWRWQLSERNWLLQWVHLAHSHQIRWDYAPFSDVVEIMTVWLCSIRCSCDMKILAPIPEAVANHWACTPQFLHACCSFEFLDPSTQQQMHYRRTSLSLHTRNPREGRNIIISSCDLETCAVECTIFDPYCCELQNMDHVLDDDVLLGHGMFCVSLFCLEYLYVPAAHCSITSTIM